MLIQIQVGQLDPGGTILKTTNGGSSWETQNSGTEEFLISSFFINSNTGWVVGSNGSILKTTNGGVNWLSQTSGTSEALVEVFISLIQIMANENKIFNSDCHCEWSEAISNDYFESL